MRKTLIFLTLCLAVASCKKSGEGDGPQTGAAPNYRVTQITGHNSHWGDYTMKVQYHRDAIDSIVVFNTAGDRISTLKASQAANALTLRFSDIIPNIDADSIAALVAEYGEQGAKEHIPMTQRTLLNVRSEMTKGVLTAQTFTFYRPLDDPGTGDDFDNNYLTDRRVRYIYEYDGQGRLAICRIFHDVFDQERNNQYVRRIYKAVAHADRSQLYEMLLYQSDERYESETDYVLLDTYKYTYSEANLQSVIGAGLNLLYTHSGANVASVSSDGQVRSFTYNADGSVSKVSYSNGDYLEMSYEEGRGDFGLLTPLFEGLFSIPTIR